MNQYLIFIEVPNPGKRTKRWTIHPLRDPGTIIGWIEFRPTWRKYVWSMSPGAVFDARCTEAVVQFLDQNADERQEGV